MATLAEHDLVVVGAGLAGLTAALRATELGLRVLVVERGTQSLYACNSRFSGGIFHVSYHDPKADAQTLREAIERSAGEIADPVLAEAIATDAGRSIDWLRASGARFVRGAISWHAWVLAPPRPLTTGLDWEGRGADTTLRALTRRLAEAGGSVMLGTRAQSLQMSGGQCYGLVAVRDGERLEIPARAVVLADGGFQGNAELFRRHIGPRPESVVQRGAGTGVGDGLAMAIAAGAATSSLDRFYGHVLSRDALHNDDLWPYPQIDALASAGVVVDVGGRRILDEGLGGVYIANALAQLEDPASATVILDASIWNGPGREAQIAPNPLLEQAGGTIWRAQTLAELAALAGIDPDALERTVADYNAAIERADTHSLSPGRSGDKSRAWPIVRPPFIAIPVCAGITHTMGGIAIDGHGRVLRPDGTRIDGLYAAGTTTGGLEGGPRAAYVGGLIKASVLGLRAAEDAARRLAPEHSRAATTASAPPSDGAAPVPTGMPALAPSRFPVLGGIVRFGAVASIVLAVLAAALVLWGSSEALGALAWPVAGLAGLLAWVVARSYVELVTVVTEMLIPR